MGTQATWFLLLSPIFRILKISKVRTSKMARVSNRFTASVLVKIFYIVTPLGSMVS